MNLINNPTKKTQYLDITSRVVVEDVWKSITAKTVREASLGAHELNSFHFAPNPRNYSPVLSGLIPIPPRTVWMLGEEARNLFFNPSTNSFTRDYELDFNRVCKKILSIINLSNLAVEVSGGLDTSIIISLLREAGLNPPLVGFSYPHYEFRTEKYLQNNFCSSAPKYRLLKSNAGLPYMDILKVPRHPLPNKASLFFARHKVTAEAALEMGISLILNGIGADALLCDAVPFNGMPYSFHRSNINDEWPNEFIFQPLGCEYVSAVTLAPISKLVYRLRMGACEDSKKLWARNFFSEILPLELSRFAYKGAHDAVYQEGIEEMIPLLDELGNVAYSVTKNELLRPDKLKGLASDPGNASHEETVFLMARISYCVWIYGLIRDGII
jgi:hypothetical protein